jgi:hypothetical protein
MLSVYNHLEGFQKLRQIAASYAGRAALLMTAALLSFGHLLAFSRFLEQPAQPTFASAEQAAGALIAAVRSDNQQTIIHILGGAKELIASGNELDDKRDRVQFVRKYEEMHRLVRESDGTTVLYIGAENWPFPIPLASQNGRWYFDAGTGSEEIFFRQIGENETAAIATCHDLAVGSRQLSKLPVLSHGYYFERVSERARGNSDGNFIVVAYPAEYRSSGVMTFVATHDGKVYEQDLGPDTSKLASSIHQWTPDVNWRLAQ